MTKVVKPSTLDVTANAALPSEFWLNLWKQTQEIIPNTMPVSASGRAFAVYPASFERMLQFALNPKP